MRGGLPHIWLCVFAGLCITALAAPGQQQRNSHSREFPPGSLEHPGNLPASRLRDKITRLPAPARERAVAWLNSFHFTEADLPSLDIDSQGGVLYVDHFEIPSGDETTDDASVPEIARTGVPVAPFPQGLVFHSRPGAPNVLYLDFDGEDVTGTQWNTELSRSTIPALPFSIDEDYTVYNDEEQRVIKRTWQRVAEDYAAFNVNVTTERPPTFNSRTAHALITGNKDANGAPNPFNSAGGIAYVNVFGTSSFARLRPAWIYHDNLGNSDSNLAEATSHELGHNLGLSHDGTTSKEYYGGHGSGDTSWGPLMGTAYGRNVTQWSMGEYYLASNTQDDLAVIAGKLGWLPDDHGNTFSSATPLKVTSGTNILATTTENDPSGLNSHNKGIIVRNTDVDVFSFSTGSGPVNLLVRPWVSPSGNRGGNLDLIAELFSEAGVLLLSNNPPSTTTASVQTNLSAGLYYLRVRNTGAGSPMSSSPSGYTAYGSLGQYFISGTIASTALVTISTVRLDLNAFPESWGTVAPGGGVFPQGGEVEIAAQPAPYYTFKQWSGSLNSTNNPAKLVLSSDTSLVAHFAEIMTKQHPTPHWWLAENGHTSSFETAVTEIGANGYPLWQSYLAGLQPNDPESRLLVSIEGGPAGPVLTWPTVPGRVYTVLHSTKPLTGYVPVPGAVNLPAGANKIAINPGGFTASVFYRVQVAAP
jgi:hypothetical protein